MNKWLKLLLTPLATVLLGASLTLAFAPYEVFPLAILAPAGLIYLLQYKAPKQAAWLGFLFGLGFFGTGVHWVFISIHDIGNVPTSLSIFVTSGMIAFLSLYPTAACYTTNRYFPAQPTVSTLFAFPAIWCLSEFLRAWLFSGFPWLLLGYSQTNSPLSGYAPLLGVYGVSLATILTSSLLVNILTQLKQHRHKHAYLNLLAISLIWIAGGLFSLLSWTSSTNKPVSVSLVQGNIPQEMKWSPEHLQLSFDTYSHLSEPLWGKHDFIIWPEAAIPLPLQNAREFIDAMDKKALFSGSHLILGIPIKASNSKGYYNGIITRGQDKKVYYKRRLVPFGEYAPFANTYLGSIFKLINLPLPDMESGDLNQESFTVGGIKILSSICYEIAFPELTRSRDRDIGLILTLTNDAWFGKSNAQAQHLQMAEMRAQELRRPALFVSNDGITAIISPKGRIEAAAPPHQPYVLTGTIDPMQGMTPWMRNGTDPFLLLLICMLSASIKLQRKHSQLPESILTDNQTTS